MNGRSQVWAETGVGAAVIAAAAAFLIYALSHTTSHGGGYQVFARFGQVGSLAPGADVRLAGVKIGSVSGVSLDTKTFLARTTFSIDPSVKLPADSTAKITSDGLLGGQHVAIEPGGSMQDMKPGSEFQNVQGAVDLFGLIGAFLRPGAGGSGAAAGSGATSGAGGASSIPPASTPAASTPAGSTPGAGAYGSP